MQRKLVYVLRVFVALSFLLSGALTVSAEPPRPRYDLQDVGPVLRSWDITPDRLDLSLPTEASASSAGQVGAQAAAIGQTKYWLGLDDYLGRYVIKLYTLRAIGTYGEVWVANNLAYPTGDPRPADAVTADQVQYLLGQFDTVIYPKMTQFFRAPDPHDGANAYLPSLIGLPPDYYQGEKVVILIDNIRDDRYYDPTYPNYIAGFYSPSYEVYFDRNVMSIDSYDWVNRTGPSSARPYLYEGVFTHEYQHLLHGDADPDEETFLNEGLADLSQWLVGYGSPLGHTSDLAERAENSLVVWNDQGPLEILADYGVAYMFQLYMYEQFGGLPFIRYEFNNPANGITSINQTLRAARSSRDFAAVYHDFSVALAIDSKTPAGTRYQFQNMDFKVVYNDQAYNTPGAPPWGADYIQITGDPKKLAKLTFNGVDYLMLPSKWSVVDGALWSGGGDLVDNWAIFAATGGGTLTFDTTYDIEPYWDFGFVQVSTDGGHSWTSLANQYTTSEHDIEAHPKVVENLPGLTGASDWVTMSFDLSAYAGQQILIAFRYVTDWATYNAGWYVDNVSVDGSLISDGTSMAPFKDITEILPINAGFTVTFIGMSGTGKGTTYKAITLNLAKVTNAALVELNKVLKSSTSAAMLVTYDAPEGISEYAGYDYAFTYANSGPKK